MTKPTAAESDANPEKGNSANLAERLRKRRKELGLTMQQVADSAGLSVGFISQVERELATPSLSSLVSIARTLNQPVSEFLQQPQGDKPHTRHDRRPAYSVSESSLQYERVSARFPGNVLNSVIIHEPPGHRSEPIRHEGEEMFFILNGAITVEVEDEVTVLQEGDSIHFDSRRRHSAWNHTTEPVTMLHVCTMDVFGEHDDQDSTPGNRARHNLEPEPKGSSTDRTGKGETR